MSESNQGTSDMDTGGPTALKQTDETVNTKDTDNKIPDKMQSNNLDKSKEVVESPNKTNISKPTEVNGDETTKSPEKTEQNETEDLVKSKDNATKSDDAEDKSLPVKSDADSEKPKETEQIEEDMEVSAESVTTEEDSVNPTPQRKRRSSSSDTTPKTPIATPRSKRNHSPSSAGSQSEGRVKRQRRQVEKFQATPGQEATPTTSSSVKLYDKNTTLAVRADGATFYLCRCLNPVHNTNKRFKVRWFEIEEAPDLYRLAYEDRVELECVIGPAHLQRARNGLLRLTPPELTRIKQLIQAAENGEDVTKLDPELFKPQTAKVKAAGKDSQREKTSEAGDTDVEPENEEPTPKRARKATAATATPKTPKERPSRKARTPKSETPKAGKTPKTPKTSRATPAKKAAPTRGKRQMNKIVSIAQAAPLLRKTATLDVTSLQRRISLLRRPTSLLRQTSLQKWPSIRGKPKRVKREPGAPKLPRPPIDPNKKLKHNPRVTVWEKDPLFESRIEVPFVSSLMHSRLAIRAVKLKDKEMLEEIFENTSQISNVNIQRSCHSEKNTMAYAVLSEDKDLIKMLYDEERKYRSRAQEPLNLMTTMDTGTYNPRTLPGVKAVRKLKVSRGGREGNNALTKDRSRHYNPGINGILKKALEENVSYDTIKYMMDFNIVRSHDVFIDIVSAVQNGHRKLASRLMDDIPTEGIYGFNFMHRESLKFDKAEDFTGKLLEASVLKNPLENRNMRPIHCAAINPDTKYLTKMLSICSDWNVEDRDKRRPIHYAAACEGTGPLKLLLDKHISLSEADQQGYTPLIIACITGRAENVKVILNKLIEQERSISPEDEDETEKKKPSKFGPGGVNRPMKNTWCPIHFATANKRKDVIEVLVDMGADINKNVGANFNRITPLIMAAQEGDLDFVKFIIQKGAKIEKPDKLKRTALTHAIREGNANVASYLLNRGADPNTTDSSGNTALHYAAAYGWYFCMKVLLDAGANPDPANDWKLTPLGASFLKGNLGLTKILMDLPGVNIDFQDDEGKTLLHHTLERSPYTKKTVDDVKMLVVQKNANVQLLDKQSRNAIQYIFMHSLPTENSWWRYNRQSDDNRTWQEARKDAVNASKEILEILMEKGCESWPKTGSSNIFYMTFNHQQGSRPIEALKFVFEKHPWLEDSKETASESGVTLLHYLTNSLPDEEKFEMLHYLCKVEVEGRSGLEEFRKMAKVKRFSDGRTSLISMCNDYSSTSKGWNESTEDFLRKMATYRDHLKFLIEDLGSELEYVWEKDKNNKYHMTVLRPLLSCTSEEGFAAFDMALKYKPTVDFKFADGHTLLLEQVKQGDYGKVIKLLDSGADVNQRLEDKSKARMTPLLLCLWHDRRSILPRLLGSGADRNAIKEDTKETALHIAITRCSDVQGVMTELITKDTNINVQDKKLRTPLHLVMNRSTDSPDESKKLEHLLLKNGADPFMKDIRGRMPIHYLFVKIGQHKKADAMDPVESYSILSIAMKNQKLDEPDKFGQTPLHRAAFRGATVCAMLLIQRECNVNAKDNDGNTPLSFAVWNGHDSCALMMIQKGADINGDVITDPTADIHPKILAKKKAEEEADESKQNGPTSNTYMNHLSSGDSDESDSDMECEVTTSTIRENIRRIKQKPVWKFARRHFPRPWKPGKKGYPIFQGLVMNGWQGLTFLAMDLLEPFGMQYASVVEIALTLRKFRFAMNLMEKQLDNAKLRVKNAKGQTLLHVLALVASSNNESLQEKIVEDLITERGVDVNDQDADGFTALHQCILKQNWNRAHQLIDGYNLNLDLKDKYGRSPFSALIWFGTNNSSFRSLLTKLIRQGAKKDVLVDFPPMSVQDKGYLPQVDVTDYYRPYDNKPVSPLIVAVLHCWHDVVQDLLKAGTSPNFADNEGITPLMYAVQTGNVLLVSLLLDPKIHINTFDTEERKRCEQIQNGDLELPIITDDDLFAGLPPSPGKKSSVNVDAVDSQGRTAVHHLLTTLQYGAFEDLRILKILSDAKATLDMKDKDGKSPLDLALERGALTMAKAIQSLLGVPKAEWRYPKFEPFTVEDNLTWDGPEIDFVADAQAMLKVMEEEEAKMLEKMPRAIPDDRLNIENAEVVMDEEIDMPYDILMTKVDVKVGEFGLYNFYKMQVVHDTAKDLYLLFNCWGRIGDRGQYQRTPFKSDKEAREEFAKIFKAKSGNEWKDVKTFEVKPKRYRLVDADYRRKNTCLQVQYNLTSDLPSKLPPYLQDLIAELSNVSMLRSSMQNTGIDIPFGRLKRENLIKARELLSELHDLAHKLDDFEENLTTDNIEEYRLTCEQVAELSSEYYYLIPVSGYVYETLEPLKNTYQIEQRIDSLTRLLEFEFTGSVLLGAQHRIKDMNPYDYIYRALKIHVQQLPENSTESQTLLRYISVKDGTEIEAIYRMERHGEPERLAGCEVKGNHTLLWHGSRTSNLLSILSRGLLIAPKNVPVTGMAFGKGIYTADYFGKSENYCYNDGGGRTKYMLLCEVAVGSIHHVDDNSDLPEVLPPEGSNCLQANGRSVPDPRYDAILPTGTKIPLGPLTENCAPYTRPVSQHWHSRYRSINYNEFIVYSEDQVCLRYIVQFR